LALGFAIKEDFKVGIVALILLWNLFFQPSFGTLPFLYTAEIMVDKAQSL